MILSESQSALEQVGTVAAVLVGFATVGLSIYSTVMTRRQAAAQVRVAAAAARNEEAIVELQRNQSAALVRLAQFEQERRTEELEERDRILRVRASADLRAELSAAGNDTSKFWLRLTNVGQSAATEVAWTVTHDASIILQDPLNGSLVLKQDEQHQAIIVSAEFPIPLEISWRDGAGEKRQQFRLPRPPRLA